MPSPKQRDRLVKPDELERIFDAATLKRLSTIAEVPDRARPRFEKAVRACAADYLAQAAELRSGEIHDLMAALAKAVYGALARRPGAAETAAQLLADLPEDARRVLSADGAAARDVPTSEDLLDPESGHEALALVYGSVVSGATRKTGRRRPGGKRSRDTLKRRLAGPYIAMGRPPNEAEVELCARLAIDYAFATEESVSRLAIYAPSRGNLARSPFAFLLQEIFGLVGAQSIDADAVVRAYLKIAGP